MAEKQQTIVTTDWTEDGKEKKKVKLKLPPNLVCEEQRETVTGWAATLRYFDVTCVLRERKRGTIECEADWVRSRSGRERTGTHRKKEAIEWAHDRLEEAHLDKFNRGQAGSQEVTTGRSNFRLSDAALLLKRKGLIPGKEGSKTRAGYELVLDIAEAVWDEDPLFRAIGQDHVDRLYDARARLDEDDERPGFEWPSHMQHRRKLSRVRPQTVQGDLVDLKTLFNKVLGVSDAEGNKFADVNPLANLDLGDFSKRVLPEAGPDRYPWVFEHADATVEKVRSEGYKYSERRYRGGEWREYERTAVLPDVVPGILRHMLVVQFGHGNRPGSWRHIRVDTDIARTASETGRLLRSLKLKEHDERIPPDWAKVWAHGAYAYRRRFFKGRRGKRYERAVPLSAGMAAEHDLYMERRAAWLDKLGVESVWLFPSPRDPREVISDEDARLLLNCGERVARQAAKEAGHDPDELVPELEDTAWYAYRRYFKSLRNVMGWEANKNAAYVGGWTTKAGAIADTVYARFAPHMILAVVEGKTILEAIRDDTATEAAKQAARVRP